MSAILETSGFSAARFRELAKKYRALRVAVVGDFCLDRYLEIDPKLAGVSIETGLPVHHVVNVRSQPGGAGTIVNNLAALGVGEIIPVGFAGEDGEGFELMRSMARIPQVKMNYFLQTSKRQTFTYTKPLVVIHGQAPRELNRIDFLNLTPTPREVQKKLMENVRYASMDADAMIILDQVDMPNTGVVTNSVVNVIGAIKARRNPLIIADSRQRLREFPPLCFKMNQAELSRFVGASNLIPASEVGHAALRLARETGNPCFITMAENGILAAEPGGKIEHVPALPVLGEIDVVGAGDCVTANLTAALAAGATLREAVELANAAASVVLHKLGTTGSASMKEIQRRL